MKLKDNKIFRCIIIPICLALCFLGRFIPAPEAAGLSSSAMGVIFIFIGSLILWLTIGIDWPSLLCVISLAFLDGVGFKTALQSSFGNDTFIFLLFTFICTYALSKTSLIKRIAIAFIDNKLAKKSGYWFMILFLTSVLLLGLFISPSVLFVIILPILTEVFDITKIEKGEKIAKFLMMGLGFTVSISSGMTTIAHVFPVLAMNAANVSVSPITYMGFAIPVGLMVFLLMILVFLIFIRKDDVKKLSNADLSSLKEKLTKVSKSDIVTLVIFLLVIVAWIIPSLFKDVNPTFYNTINGFTTAMPPLVGTLLLCIIRIDNKPLLRIDDAFKNGVPWGSLLMCAATLLLGSVLTSNDIGLKAYLQATLGNALANVSAIPLLIIFGIWAALQTNLSSNMVTATLVATVASSIITTSGVQINLAAIACIIGMLASFAFATPPSMPHIAIVAGSEYCDTKNVLIFGGILMIISVVVALIVGYPIAMNIM